MTTITRPTLPAPTDPRAEIRAMKQEIGASIDVEASFRAICERIEAKVEAIETRRARGEEIWPTIDYADLEAGDTAGLADAIHEHGCLVVRGHFPREQALAWDADLVRYLDANRFDAVYRGPGDDFFGSLGADASRPQILPIYWSRTQMEARQHPRMARVQQYLNRLWTHESSGRVWFDPDVDCMYADRIRRRPPGTDSGGLGAHTDSGSLERWLTPAYQDVFRHVFRGNVDDYDPWDAAHRPDVDEYEGGTTMCSMFRTFQGWTALSDMQHDQGVLHVVPIPEAMAYILLRALQPDVPDDELCGVTPKQVLPVSERWHPLLMRALTPIPDLRAGDSVWWHCDVVHSVAPVTDQQGWGNVMYIPAAPLCDKNRAYSAALAARLESGESPSDFPEEHYERDWADRFRARDLNDIGRRGLGIEG